LLVLERIAPASLDGTAKLSFEPRSLSWELEVPLTYVLATDTVGEELEATGPPHSMSVARSWSNISNVDRPARRVLRVVILDAPDPPLSKLRKAADLLVYMWGESDLRAI
jgi:hypothetical protein